MRYQQRTITELQSKIDEKVDRVQFEQENETKAGIEDVRRALDHVADMLDDKVSRDFLSQQLESYVGKSDFERVYEDRVTREEFERILEEKVEIRDFRDSFNQLKGTMDDFIRETKNKWLGFASFKEMGQVKDELDKKANIEEMRKLIEDKTDRTIFDELLARKVDIEEIENIVEKKVDITDFEQLLSVVERKAEQNLCERMVEILEGKADKGEIDHVMSVIQKKVEKQETDKLNLDLKCWKTECDKWLKLFDKNLESHRKDLLGYKGENEALVEKLNKKAERKETDRLSNLLGRKVDAERVAEEVSRLKKDWAVESKSWKTEMTKQRQQSTDEVKEKTRKLEKGQEVLGEEIGHSRVESGQFRAEWAKMLDDVVKNSKSMSDGLCREFDLKLEKLGEEIAIIGKDNEKLVVDKLEKNDFTDLMKDVTKSQTMKVDCEEVQASLNSCQADIAGKLIDLRDEFIKAVKNQGQEQSSLIAKKANLSELKSAITEKLDQQGADDLMDRRFNELGLDGVITRVRKMEDDLNTRLGQKQYDAQIRFLRENIDEIQKSAIMKANFQDVCSLLDTKSSDFFYSKKYRYRRCKQRFKRITKDT